MFNPIPQAFIDELLNRVDIVSVIEARVPLKKAGNSYKACCPFHAEKTASFTVSPSKQLYHCFGCNASGNIISFLLAYEQLTFIEAIESLASLCGLTVPRSAANELPAEHVDENKIIYAALTAAGQFYYQQLSQHADKSLAIDYLKARHITGATAKQFMLGYAPAGWDKLLKHLATFKPALLAKAGLLIARDTGEHYDRFRHRVMFPIRDRRGRMIGFGGRVIDAADSPKYLNSPETAVFQKRSTLYGLYEILQAHRSQTKLLVVEGYMDVVALAQFGIHYAVATLGTAITPEHIQLLLRYTQHIIFCFDGDTAGRAAAWKSLQLILPCLTDSVRVEFLFLPAGEDPDSLVRKEGKTSFEQRLSQATALTQYLLTHLSVAVNLRELEGQAKLAHLAAPLLKQIPAVLLRYKLLEELAHLTHMDLNTLSALTLIALPVSASGTSRRPQAPAQRHLSLMQQAIMLLLQNPSLADDIVDLTPWQHLNLPGADIFLKLLELLQKTPHLSSGNLLEYWRNDTIFDQLQSLAKQEMLIPATGLTAEFNAVLEKLLHYEAEQLLEQLQRKADQNKLSEPERQEYVRLLSHRHS